MLFFEPSGLGIRRCLVLTHPCGEIICLREWICRTDLVHAQRSANAGRRSVDRCAGFVGIRAKNGRPDLQLIGDVPSKGPAADWCSISKRISFDAHEAWRAGSRCCGF
jgi:hypothetical protein